MKNRFAKFFSIILVITMMAGTLPVSRAVYAAENETATETEAKKDESDNEKGGEVEKTPASTEKQDKDSKETDATKESEKVVAESTVSETTESEDKKPEQTESVESSESKETEPSESGEKETEASAEPSETETKEPETSESQAPTETEASVHEVKPDNGPAVTVKRKAKKEVAIKKDQNNTFRLVKSKDVYYASKIDTPYPPSESRHEWMGCYVYFGHYGINPIKFRILAPSTTVYGGSTMFLDSDEVLFKKRFDDDSNVWANSELRKYLNGEFLSGSFTSVEQSAIAKSKGYGSGKEFQNPSAEYTLFGSDQVEVNDKVFLLSAREVENREYGYSDESGWFANDWSWDKYPWAHKSVESRYKTGTYWWLRSASTRSSVMQGLVKDSVLDFYYVQNEHGVAPALNVDLSSVLFYTRVSGEDKSAGAEYKLTLKDPSLSIEVQSGKAVTISGRTVKIPYKAIGMSSRESFRASVWINNDQRKCIYYDAMDGFSGAEGTCSFTLPEGLDLSEWGKRYFVEILVEQINGSQTTDYASEMVELDAPVSPFNVSLNVLSISSDGRKQYVDGYTGGTPSLSKLQVLPGDTVEVSAIPKSGFFLKKIEWFDEDTPKTDITSEKSFVVGTKAPTVIVYFQADPKEYSISYHMETNGKVTVTPSKAKSGDVVTVTATPNSGYYVEKITWKFAEAIAEHDITVDKCFIMPNADVIVKVYFQTLTVTPKTVKVKYKKLKKKAQTVACSKAMTVSNAQGALKYSLVSVKRGKSKKYKKYFKINAKTGNVTVKKKLKKGTYKITCKVTAGNNNYQSVSKTVTFKIKVK